MINMKKAVFVLCVAAGFAGSVTSVYALPTREMCEEAKAACDENGNENDCALVKRLCSVYGIYV